MEIEDNEKLNHNIYFILCHYCKQMKKPNNLINCTCEDCKESFCDTCINKIFNYNYQVLKIEYEENGWICFKCRNLCKCKSCTNINNSLNENDLNYNFYPKIFNDPIEKGKNNLTKNITKINKEKNTKTIKPKIDILDILNDKNFKGKKIKEYAKNKIFIEIKEEKTNEENEYLNYYDSKNDASLIESLCKNYKPKHDPKEMKFPFIPTIKKFQSRLKIKLIKIAKTCEHYYRHKCKCECFKKKCLICDKLEHHTNELLRFKNSDDFINYLRYIYTCMNDVVDYKHKIFSENKEELFEFYKIYDKGTSNWSFSLPKTLCKLCLFEMVNCKNSLKKFKFYLDDNYLKDNKNVFQNPINNSNIMKIILNEKKELNENKNKNKNIKDFQLGKYYDELDSILFALLTNVYKFIIIFYSFNQNRMQNFSFFDNQNYKIYYENIINFEKEIKNYIKLYNNFQVQYQNKMNDFFSYYYYKIPNNSIILIREFFQIKIENSNFSQKINELIEKFINKFTECLNDLSQIYKI